MPTPIHRVIAAQSTRVIFRLTVGTAVRVKVSGIENFPTTGPAILASNHVSHFDPVLFTWLPRWLDWMAMRELFSHPVGGAFLRSVGAFEVNRDGSDRKALRVALRRLKEGAIVGIFPEGGIRAGAGSILNGAEMRPGVAALAAMTGVPVIPCAILGSDRLYHSKNWRPFRRVPVWILIGKPIEARGRGGAADRKSIQDDLASAFVDLQNSAVKVFSLAPDDLPATPQARKGADPEPFRRKR